MARTDKPIAAVLIAVETHAVTRRGRAAWRRWSETDPAFTAWAGAYALAVEVSAGPPVDQDRVVAALAGVAGRDELAQLTTVAVVSRALGAVVSGWAAAGVPAWELDEMEAELVAGCWEAAIELAHRTTTGVLLPTRPAQWLTERARESVRVPRRRQRRAARRQAPIDEVAALPAAGGRPVCEELAGEIGDAVRAGRLSRREACPVFLTRVAGYRVSEAAVRLGCTDAVLRTRRARAERHLIAAAA